jgi:hypothetical protein
MIGTSKLFCVTMPTFTHTGGTGGPLINVLSTDVTNGKFACGDVVTVPLGTGTKLEDKFLYELLIGCG